MNILNIDFYVSNITTVVFSYMVHQISFYIRICSGTLLFFFILTKIVEINFSNLFMKREIQDLKKKLSLNY
jgi:hypothetical protein